MAVAKDVQGTVFQNATAMFMARVENSAGEAINRAAVSAAGYSVYELAPSDPQSQTPVTGHEHVSLVVDDVVFDTLQTDDVWSVDQVGYNFRHELDVATHEAFSSAGAVYQVRYELTPTVGQKIVFRFQLRCL